jgi:hypothetical protein
VVYFATQQRRALAQGVAADLLLPLRGMVRGSACLLGTRPERGLALERQSHVPIGAPTSGRGVLVRRPILVCPVLPSQNCDCPAVRYGGSVGLGRRVDAKGPFVGRRVFNSVSRGGPGARPRHFSPRDMMSFLEWLAAFSVVLASMAMYAWLRDIKSAGRLR